MLLLLLQKQVCFWAQLPMKVSCSSPFCIDTVLAVLEHVQPPLVAAPVAVVSARARVLSTQWTSRSCRGVTVYDYHLKSKAVQLVYRVC